MSRKERNLLAYWVASWLILANLFIVYRFAGLNWAQEVLRFSGREWAVLFLQATFIGVTAGAGFGALDVYLRRTRRIREMGFGRLVLLKSSGFTLITLIVVFVGFVLAALINGFTPDAALARAIRFATSGYAVVILLYFFVNSLLANFVEQVSEKFGAAQLARVLSGRYYHPTEEARVFVFLDLKSSTTYAELLGHIRYSRLIQDFFSDITAEVQRFDAEIYQYVGDEIVLTWEMDGHGPGERTQACCNAVRLCYAFRRRLSDRAAHYESAYGFVPAFKVGMSAGPVTAAEVGVTKKEIAYHGDVLNTGARIQEQCVAHGQFLLCSEAVVESLRDAGGFRIDPIGEMALKGKASPVPVFSVSPVEA